MGPTGVEPMSPNLQSGVFPLNYSPLYITKINSQYIVNAQIMIICDTIIIMVHVLTIYCELYMCIAATEP